MGWRRTHLLSRLVLSRGRTHKCQQARSAAARAEIGPEDVKRDPLIARTGNRAQIKLLSIGPEWGGPPSTGCPSIRHWMRSIPVLYPVAQMMTSAGTKRDLRPSFAVVPPASSLLASSTQRVLVGRLHPYCSISNPRVRTCIRTRRSLPTSRVGDPMRAVACSSKVCRC